MTRHTKGPWRIGDAGNTIFGALNGAPSPITVATMRGADYTERQANARLIAKAPELLELLTLFVLQPEIHSEDMARARALIAEIYPAPVQDQRLAPGTPDPRD